MRDILCHINKSTFAKHDKEEVKFDCTGQAGCGMTDYMHTCP